MTAPALPLPVWVDAQLPPALARWIHDPEHLQAAHVSEIGLLTAEDPEIFERGAIVITKDEDFVRLQEQRGAPPRLCG